MHITAEDNQQTSDNCKDRKDLTEFLTHKSASAVTKSLRGGTRLSWHFNTKTVFQRTKYSDLGCPLKGQGYIPNFTMLNYYLAKQNLQVYFLEIKSRSQCLGPKEAIPTYVTV